MQELHYRHRQFVVNYLQTNNATQAAIAAGYSEKYASNTGSQIMAREDVKSYLRLARDARAERVKISIDDVVRELAHLAFINPQDMYDEHGNLKNISDMDPAVAKAISHLEVKELWGSDENGVEPPAILKKIKTTDKLKALKLLGEHLGMFTENININQNVKVQSVGFHVIKDSSEINQDNSNTHNTTINVQSIDVLSERVGEPEEIDYDSYEF